MEKNALEKTANFGSYGQLWLIYSELAYMLSKCKAQIFNVDV